MQSDPQSFQVQDAPQQVEVTILLDGGYQYVLSLQSNSLLLQQLFETVVDQSAEKRGKRLFQIPIKQGKAVLCFPNDRLIGIVTEPPLVLQQQTTAPSPSTDAQSPSL